MHFTPETPRASVTINKSVFTVPQPFAEGHPCTAGEASALNQTLKENARNNLSPREGLTQEAVDAYVAEYQFGVRTGGTRTVDPVERKARQIARSQIEAKLRERNATLDKEQLAALVEQLSQRKEVRAEAERQIKAEQRAASVSLDELLGEAPAAEAA